MGEVSRRGVLGGLAGSAALSAVTGDKAGDAQGRLDLSTPAEPGTLFLELSDPRGNVDWIGIPYEDPGDDPYRGGSGYQDGRRVGDAELSPACTDYDRRVLYTTHDVTSLLRRDRNALGVALGRGFFATRAPDSDATHLSPWIAEPRVRAQLEVTFADGRRTTIGSGPDWSLAEGPTTYDGLYTGESYDARRARQLRGWTEPGHSAGAISGWRSAAIVDGPGGRLRAHAGEPIRAGSPVRPVAVSRPAEGCGCTGGCRRAPRCGCSTARSWGRAAASRSARRVATRTCRWLAGSRSTSTPPRAGGAETWQPSFTYKGFRYVEVSGTDRPLELVAVPVVSDLSDTMGVRLDHPVLQWIVDAFRQTARNGLHGLPDVSPMYSRFGWTGNTHFASRPMLYMLGMAGLFDKWLDDIRLSQAPNGELPIITPVSHDKFGGLSPAWTGVYPHLVHRYWLIYGDPTVPAK